MHNDFYENYQYDGCVSRGICSINPKNSALQTVIVLYLRLFAKYAVDIDLSDEVKNFILNTISITIYNPDFNEDSFEFAVSKFKIELPKIIDKFSALKSNDLEEEKGKALELFNETSDIVSSIKFGERIFNRASENISSEIRDLYNIMLVITKSLSINILVLESYGEKYEKGFIMVLNLLSLINLNEKSIKTLKDEIFKASEIDVELMKFIRATQEKHYGAQRIAEVSYTTIPNKAVLVVGSNIRELEVILEALKDEDIDIYTHDDMMLAHTFPKFSEYERLKGQFGQGVENCLLDFATFPGPIILTKHSLHNIDNLYRGRLFTTDYVTAPKGIIKIENNDFSKVIKSALEARGFKRGKQCETVEIGFDYERVILQIKAKLEANFYEQIFIIGLEGYSLEQQAYFEKLIKLLPENVLIISFSYKFDRDNLIHINTCFDCYSWMRIYEFLKESTTIKKRVFIPKCERSSVSQMIYLSQQENTTVLVGKCTPIILNPSLINTLKTIFSIESITNSKKDLEKLV